MHCLLYVLSEKKILRDNVLYCLTCKEQQGVLAHCSAMGNILSAAIHTTLMQTHGLECFPKARQDSALQQQLYICTRNKPYE
jgi:hypothetical protein